jgi:hypothetical protein
MAVSVQDHIHLALLSTDITSNLVTSQWKVYQDGWSRSIDIRATAERTAGGKLRPYAMKTTAGVVVKPRHYTYSLKLDEDYLETIWQREDRLMSLLGQTVYFLPNAHDQGNHATGLTTYFLSAPQGWDAFDPMLRLQRVSIMLQEIL